MTRLRLLLFLGLALIFLFLGLGAGVWWYLFGGVEIDSAELVPANTIAFATIPNGVAVFAGYQSSQAKTLIDSPNFQPVHAAIVKWIGPKNTDLLHTFLPNLSGQSFIAVTHFDYDHPEQVGLIAGMKPKTGLGDFATFLEKLKATWPDTIKQGKTGTGNVDGVDYDWIQGPGAPDKICVAQYHGWIITSWGEASLQDWLERFQKKSTTSSLAEDMDYKKSLARVGDNPMTLVYVNYHAVLGMLQKQMSKTNPALGDYLAKKLDALGGASLATRFENGEIVDRFSFLFPRSAQLASGMAMDPCPFDTLKFTGPNTRFYWASSINWQQYYKNLKEQPDPEPSGNATVTPLRRYILSYLRTWALDSGLDPQHNIVDALGPELSVQAEWIDTAYPEVGLFVKVDKPDDFKPTITAIIESVRKAYATSAVIREISLNGQNFAALKFVESSPITPTITEDGPYLGIFLTENQAVRSFQRDPTLSLDHRADFTRQVGDKRNGAQQVLFLDSPYLLDHAYQAAMPYLSIAEMFNKDLAAVLKGKDMPSDLTWLAPMGTWSCVISPDEEGMDGYSVSGIGNQGILLSGAVGGAASMLQTMGLLPKITSIPGTPSISSPTIPLTAQPAPSLSPGNTITSLPTLPNLPVLQNNPASSTADEVPDSIIYITSDSKIFFDHTPVPPDQFGDFLKAKKAANQDLKLFIHMDKNASQDVLALVMDAGAHAGFGVLSYTYTSGMDSQPLATGTNAAPANPAAVSNQSASSATNSAPAALPENAAPGNGASADSGVVPNAPSSNATTNSTPATNLDATPPNPQPAPTQ